MQALVATGNELRRTNDLAEALTAFETARAGRRPGGPRAGGREHAARGGARAVGLRPLRGEPRARDGGAADVRADGRRPCRWRAPSVNLGILARYTGDLDGALRVLRGGARASGDAGRRPAAGHHPEQHRRDPSQPGRPGLGAGRAHGGPRPLGQARHPAHRGPAGQPRRACTPTRATTSSRSTTSSAPSTSSRSWATSSAPSSSAARRAARWPAWGAWPRPGRSSRKRPRWPRRAGALEAETHANADIGRLLLDGGQLAEADRAISTRGDARARQAT